MRVKYSISTEELERLRRVLEEYEILEVSDAIREFIRQELPEFANKLPPLVSRTLH